MASIQFTGLSSGLDTDSMVQAMLMTHQSRIDAAKQEKKLLEWKQEEWKEINNQINDFYTKYVDKLRMQSTFQSYTTTSSSSAVTPATSGSMTEGTHVFSDIKLAKEISKTGVLDSSISSESKSFKDLGLLSEGESRTIKVETTDENGKAVTKEIEITHEDTLQTLEDKLEAAESNLRLNFDIKNHKVFVGSKNTGEESTLKVEFEDCDLFTKLGLTQLVDRDGTVSSGTKWDFKGTNATYTYNGVSGYTSSSNDIVVNGVKVTLEEETTEEVTVKVKSSADKVVAFMEEFVTEYNKLLDTLNDKYNATKISTTLLTDAEKEKMTEKEIDEYEQNIKDTLLRRDSSLQKVINSLRSSMQSVFSDGAYKSLSAVGITTGGYTENGKLVFDEKGKEKFIKCFEENPEDVMKLFTATDSTEGASDSKKTGLASKLYDSLNSMRKRVEGLKSFTSYYNDRLTEDKLKSYTSKISELQDRYDRMEEIYKKKFAAMETALSQINSQSASFTSMLS